MTFSLAEDALLRSYRVISYESVDSTNNLAAEFARGGDDGLLWIVAESQTKGRGRRNRVWQSPKGNFYASLLLCDNIRSEHIAALGFVAGVALTEALNTILEQKLNLAQKTDMKQNILKHDIRLKWPNDVLMNNAKLAGILPEYIAVRESLSSGSLAQLRYAAIIGIGVNIGALPVSELPPEAVRGDLGRYGSERNRNSENMPDNLSAGVTQYSSAAAEKQQNDAIKQNCAKRREHEEEQEYAAPPYPVSALNSLGVDISPQELFFVLSHFWVENYALWNKGEGMAAICEKWLHYAAYKGEEIFLLRRGERINGIFETIDKDGHLVLRQKNGRQMVISAGDVCFGSSVAA